MSDTANSSTPEPTKGEFEPIVERNISVLMQKRKDEEARLGLEERIAETITNFTGSMKFVYLHLVLFSVWIAWNTVPHSFHKFDPQLIVLAMWASVEAIFLSTFILISQNRQTKRSDLRADLDLQVNLLAEHELSRLINLVTEMANRMGIETESDRDLAVASRDVHPEQVLQQIENSRRHFEEAKDAS